MGGLLTEISLYTDKSGGYLTSIPLCVSGRSFTVVALQLMNIFLCGLHTLYTPQGFPAIDNCLCLSQEALMDSSFLNSPNETVIQHTY